MSNSVKMYLEYENRMKREGLFRLLSESYEVQSVLYPGSYIHISPSFHFQEVVYVDMDKRANNLFSDPEIVAFIEKNAKPGKTRTRGQG